ncbi:MAG TPA: NADH-quinone oxidoreductase subunit H [Methylomirabilota bacterium]|nr:NADH-quinone oxidoreductase subunit H [Methylomirabilota bacterium]
MTWSAFAGLAIVLGLAPLLPGVAAKTRARLTGRRGAPLLQLYRDLARLWRKGVVYSRTTTWVFRLAPIAVLVTAVLAAFLLPLDGRQALVSFSGDFVAFAYLLALGRFLLVLAALDTGSSFEGMGASREVTVAAFAEPALFLTFVALVLATGDLSLGGALGAPLAAAWPAAAPALAMVTASVFLVLLAEASRVPVDDPATHLELTMIHEVMVLDHSGPDFALILYGGALKLALFAALLVAAVVPRAQLTSPVALAVLVAGLLGVAAAVGVVESVTARLRLSRVPQFLTAASALSALAVILLLVR